MQDLVDVEESSIEKTPNESPNESVENVICHVVGANGLWQWSILLLICVSTPSSTQFINFANSLTVQNCSNNDSCRYDVIPGQYPGSIIKEWHLLEDKEYLVSLSTSIFMGSMCLGYLVCGRFIDHFGRRFGLIVFSFCELAAGFLVSLSPTFWVYVLFRSLLGFVSVGSSMSSVILITEITTAKNRSLFLGVWEFFTTFFSRSLQSLLAYSISNWRTLHAVYYIPRILTVFYICFVNESPQWLVAKGHTSQALDVLKRGIRLNRIFKTVKIDLKDFRFSEDLLNSITRRKFSINVPTNLKTVKYFGTCRNKKLVVLSLLTVIVHGIQSFCSYGLMFYAPSLKTSIYISSFLNALMSIPGSLYFLLVYKIFSSRKWPLFWSYIFAANLLILSGSMSWYKNWIYNDIFMITLTSIAACILYGTSSMLYILTTEAFSPKMRSEALGNAMALSRIVSILCSYVNDLDRNLNHGMPIIIYGCSLLTSAVFVIFLPKEMVSY